MATTPPLHGDLIRRTFDAAAVNAVCNHEAVHPTLSLGEGVIDVSAVMDDHRNVFLMGEHGGALFHWSAPHTYDAHDFFLPEGRGPWALRASRLMLDIMFDAYGALMIWAQTPIENRACRLFNRWLGFKSEGVSRTVLFPGANPVDVETFVMVGR